MLIFLWSLIKRLTYQLLKIKRIKIKKIRHAINKLTWIIKINFEKKLKTKNQNFTNLEKKKNHLKIQNC